MVDMFANLSWLTSGTVTAPIWGGLAAIAGAFFGVAYLVFYIWMLADAIQRKLKPFYKVIWILLILITFIFALIYFFIYTPRLNRKSVWFKLAIGVIIFACLPTLIAVTMLALHR